MGQGRDAKDAAGDEPDAVRYAAAVEEIEQLLASIDRDEVDVDELALKVERAVALLKVCRAKLKATEARVVEVLKDLDDDDAAAEAAEGGADEAGEDAAPRKRKRRKKEEPAAGDSAAGRESPPLDPDEELPF